MSGHERYDSRFRRGVWTHWVPLAVTVGAAAVGLAVWMLSQRRDQDTQDAPQQHNGTVAEPQHPHQQLQRQTAGDGEPDYERGHPGARPASPRADVQPAGAAVNAAADSGEWGVRVSRMIGRTPSPVGAMLDSAGRKVSAGVAAAGAAMGNVLSAIREEDRSPASSAAGNETWSDATRNSTTTGAAKPANHPNRRRRTVAIVVSADGHGRGHGNGMGHGADAAFLEHASILSHIPRHTDFSKTKLFVLIYAPALKQGGGGIDSTNTPSEDHKALFADPDPQSAFNTVRDQAFRLVEDISMVMPFTTPNGYTYMLRHLEPDVDVVYLQESLTGENGGLVAQLQSWFRHDIIVVVGADDGHGGLADSDDSDGEEAHSPQKDVWWQKPDRVGRGRGVVVVDGMRVADDWARRVQGVE